MSDATHSEASEIQEKAAWLTAKIESSIENVGEKRRRNQRRATIVRLTTLVFSASATILLGLNIGGFEVGFKNIAFALTALVTLVAALEPFFNFRALWIEHEQAKARLHRLQDELAYYLTGKQLNELDVETLDDFKNRFNAIWVDLSAAWIRERREGTKTKNEYPWPQEAARKNLTE